MAKFTVDVDDHGLAEKLALLSRSEMRRAQRRGVTEAAKFGRGMARGLAPVATGKGRKGISYKTRSRGTTASAVIFNKVFYMRFQSTGTGERHTKSGANRGRVAPHRFFRDTKDVLEGGAAEKIISQSVTAALAKSGLL